MANAVSAADRRDSPARRPNLVFVFPDQMRGQAMGFLGEDPVVTPHLDRFARESLVLTQAASNYPVCSPYRGILPYLWVPVGEPAWGRRGVRTDRYTLEISCKPDDPT